MFPAPSHSTHPRPGATADTSETKFVLVLRIFEWMPGVGFWVHGSCSVVHVRPPSVVCSSLFVEYSKPSDAHPNDGEANETRPNVPAAATRHVRPAFVERNRAPRVQAQALLDPHVATPKK